MRGVVVGLLVGMLWARPSAAQSAQPQNTGPVIVVTGDAIVRRTPDLAFVTVAVESRARAARDAQAQNATTMTAVRGSLAGAGVPAAALRTVGVSLYPDFDNANGRQTLRGYVARNGLEIRLEDVGRVGEIADTAVQAGATSIGGVRFDLKDRAAAEQEAVRLAVQDARGRATAAAAGAGRSIDAVIRIEDRRVDSGLPRPMPLARAAGAAQGAFETTPVDPGEIEIRAQVEVTVSMK